MQEHVKELQLLILRWSATNLEMRSKTTIPKEMAFSKKNNNNNLRKQQQQNLNLKLLGLATWILFLHLAKKI